MPTFKALLATQDAGKVHASIQQLDRESLPPGEVTIRVRDSGLNYKDGLAVTGKPGAIRKFPIVPGIGLAGAAKELMARVWEIGGLAVVHAVGLAVTLWGG